MNESLATAIRPKKFSEVLGQDHPVRYLSGLILRGKISRHILLHGTVGSGKTTLARIYGRALLCSAPEIDDGSPCGSCAACLKLAAGQADSGFYEFDVGGQGGQLATVERWLEEKQFNARGRERRVLFFDEAHGLDDDASIGLLKRVEEATPDVTYIFATSEHHNMKSALRSRLVPLKVRPLQRGVAAILLRRAAKEKGLEYDDQALVMITNMVAGQPRDLLNAVDQLSVYQERVSLETVRRVFDVEYLDALRAYLLAIGQRDRDQLNQVIADWRDTPEEKMRWVLALLAGIFTRDILAVVGDVDPVVQQLGPECQVVLEQIRHGFGCNSNFELAPLWRRLLSHWRPELVGAAEAIIEAQFVTFHDAISEAVAVSGGGRAHGPSITRTSRPTADGQQGSGFLDLSDVQKILDRASLLTQMHGLYFNATFFVGPRYDSDDWVEDVELALRFCRDLEAELAHLGDDSFAALWSIEGGGNGLEARIAAHVPETVGDDAVNGLAVVRRWHRDWNDERAEARVTLRTRDSLEKPARFHWDAVRDLINALHPDVMAENRDGASASVRALLKLRLGDRRDAAIAPGPLVGYGGLLADTSIARLLENGPPPLSAVDDRAWRHVFRGWEGQEFEDRRRQQLVRKQQLADLAGQYQDNEARVAAEQVLRRSWSTDAHSLPRTWQTWWKR